MARQVRSEATRRKILDAAVDVFTEVGYASCRSGRDHRAHRDDQGCLLPPLRLDGVARIRDHRRRRRSWSLGVLGTMSDSFSPALENILHGTFVTADLFASNKVVHDRRAVDSCVRQVQRHGARGLHRLGGRDGADVSRAITEGDLRSRTSTRKWSANRSSAQRSAPGCSASRRRAASDLVGRLTQMWELLFPAIVTETSLDYYREYLAREALRHVEHDASPDGAKPAELVLVDPEMLR